VLPQTLSEITGPLLQPSGSMRWTATSRASAWPSRWASASSCRAACSTRTASPCPAPWSRSGSATRPAATTIPVTSTTRRSIPTSLAVGGREPMPRAGTASSPSSPAPIRGRTTTMPGAGAHPFSLFGPAFATRLITQMYFPNDPLLAFDPIYNSVPEAARPRLQSRLRHASTQPEWALATASTSCCAAATPPPME